MRGARNLFLRFRSNNFEFIKEIVGQAGKYHEYEDEGLTGGRREKCE